MKRGLIFFLSFKLFIVFGTFSSHAKGELKYRIAMPLAHTHYFEVEVLLNNYEQNYVDFKMPAWTPGSYLIREFAKNVESFRVFEADKKTPVECRKINKNTWRVVHNKGKEIMIQYRVYAFEGNVRMSYLDEEHAFIMANTLLMYVDDLRDNSLMLELDYPEEWTSISTSLPKMSGKKNTFYVPNYDILVDSPIEIGTHEKIEFDAAGIPHELAIVGRAEYNKDKIVRDLTKLIESATAIFEENPNEKYTFIVHATNSRGGGLEHQSSSVLNVDRWAFSRKGSYKSFLSLAAHEYLHLWIVKRLLPAELEKIDFDKEVYTDLLWVMEGFTSYFEEKIMLACGFYSDHEFINNMLSSMSQIKNTPGSGEQSVAESSFDAWIKFYRKNENSTNNQVSYYNKGMVIGALLDIEVISGSEGKHNLNDVIRQLYHQFYKKKNKGIICGDLRKITEKLSGKNLSDFFENYIYGTMDLNNERYLHLAGIGLIETNPAIISKTLGFTFENNGAELIVNSVIRGGSGYENGINSGDELIALNGYRVNHKNYHTILNHLKIGDSLAVLINRDGIIIEKLLDVRKDHSVSYTYEILKNRSELQEKVYSTWLQK